jgi:hypothetical protein
VVWPQAALNKLLEKFPPKPDDVPVWCRMIAAYYLEGDGSPLRLHFGKTLLAALCQNHVKEAFGIFTPEYFGKILPEDLADGKSHARAIHFAHAATKALSAGASLVVLVARIRSLFGSYKSLLPRPPQRVPTLDTQVALLRLWKEFPAAFPDSDVFRTETVVRWLGMYPVSLNLGSY